MNSFENGNAVWRAILLRKPSNEMPIGALIQNGCSTVTVLAFPASESQTWSAENRTWSNCENATSSPNNCETVTAMC